MMPHTNAAKQYDALIAKALATLNIPHGAEPPFTVARSSMANAHSTMSSNDACYAVVAEIQKACDPKVCVCWNPSDEIICVDFRR